MQWQIKFFDDFGNPQFTVEKQDKEQVWHDLVTGEKFSLPYHYRTGYDLKIFIDLANNFYSNPTRGINLKPDIIRRV